MKIINTKFNSPLRKSKLLHINVYRYIINRHQNIYFI